MDNFYVQVKNAETDEVVKELGPMSERKAIRCAHGIDIKIGKDFYTDVVEKAGV